MVILSTCSRENFMIGLLYIAIMIPSLFYVCMVLTHGYIPNSALKTTRCSRLQA